MIRLVLSVLAVTACTTLASAQTNTPDAAPASTVFLPRADFRLGAEYLHSDDQRFTWEGNLGGEVDLVDYVAGRLTFVANYQVILGDEFRPFDANQGNYILGGRASARVAGVEVAGVFHHVSRHLSDRPKRPSVDWNMVGVQVRRSLEAGGTQVAARVDVRGVIHKTFVDYRWELDAGLDGRLPLRPTVGLFGGGNLRILGVDGGASRGTQTGFRVEGGVRFDGGGAALELFAAAERRIDPYPLEFDTGTWATAGFRLLSR